MDEAMAPAGDTPLPALLTAVGAIRSILVTCVWFGAIAALAAWISLGGPWALGFLGGAVIGGGNLYLISLLIRRIMDPQKKKLVRTLGLLAIKIVGIYGGLGLLLLWDLTPAASVVCGFSLVLAVIVLKAAGRVLLPRGSSGPHGGCD